jgi:hypothetical protein
MADKKQVNRSIKQLQRVKTWQLVVLLVIGLIVSLTFLRLNNIGMVERRAAVIAADEVGNDEVTINRLYDLQRYVTSHMNTDMGKGTYLQASYKRDVKKAYDQASQDNNPNGNIYKKAQQVCAPKFTAWSQAYVQCTFSELGKYPAATDLASGVKLPPADMYLHVFASPLWTPDFAGWSVVVCILIVLVIVARTISLLALRIMLRSHYKSI